MANAERMVPVAELLRREGVRPAAQPAKRGRIAASAAGVVAVCGAAVTGIVGLAPTLSTPLFLGDNNGLPQPDGISGGGDSRTSARPTTDDSSPFVRASMQQTTTRPEPRKPAMSWLADDVTSDRTTSPAQQPTRTAPASDAPAAARSSTAPSDQGVSPGASGQHRQDDQTKPDGGEQPPEQRSGQDGTQGQDQGQESEQPNRQPEEHGNSQQGGPPPEERGNSAEHRNNGQADAERGKPADPGQSSGKGKSGSHGR